MKIKTLCAETTTELDKKINEFLLQEKSEIQAINTKMYDSNNSSSGVIFITTIISN